MLLLQNKLRTFKSLIIVFAISALVGSFFIFGANIVRAEDLDITPTIHSVSAGGLWNRPSTWVENRVPAAGDIVEINGVIKVNVSPTIKGLIVTKEAVLEYDSYYTSRTLTINGDAINNGKIKYYPNIDISGNITNNGEWSNYQTTFIGNNPREIKGTIGCYEVVIGDDFEILGNPVFIGFPNDTFSGMVNFNNKTLTINAPNSVTFKVSYGSGTINGTGLVKFNGYFQAKLAANVPEVIFEQAPLDQGIIIGKKISFKQGLQSFRNSIITANEIVFEGAGVKTFLWNVVLNGPVTIGQGVILQNYSNYWRPALTFNGDVTNNGAIKGQDAYSIFLIYVTGNITNNGEWSNRDTYLSWPYAAGAKYEFNISEAKNTWPEPIILTTASYKITNLLNQTRYWRVRSVIDGVLGDWSKIKWINGTDEPEIDPLILKYEPILYLHPDETYQPMNVEAYARHCSLWDSHLVDELLIPEDHESPVSLNDLATTTDSSNYYLQFGEDLSLKFPSAEKANLEYQEMKNNGEVKYSYYVTKTIDKDETNNKEYIVLEYWFFYAFNDWQEKQGLNNHEGDWEGVVIFLDNENKEPKYVAYSAHYNEGQIENPLYQYDSIRRNWDSNEVNKIGDHIISFVGAGSHANYPNNGVSGKHDVLIWDKPLKLFFDDHTSYDGLHIDNNLWEERNVLNYDQLPAWVVNYQGKWGVVNQVPGFNGSGHLYPGMNDRFVEPIRWAGIDKIFEKIVTDSITDTLDLAKQKVKIIFSEVVAEGTSFLIDLHDEIISFGKNLEDEVMLLPHFWDINSNLENGSFNAEVSLGYDAEEVAALNWSENNLIGLYYDESENLWKKIPTIVDVQNKVIRFFTNHFSRYVIGIERWQEITGDVRAVKEEEHYDKESKIKTIEIKIKNETKNNISNDLRLMVKDISEPEAVWLDYTGATSEGDLYLNIGQSYEQCVFTGDEADIPAEVSDSDKRKLLKDKPLEKNECDKMIKKYPQIEDIIDMVLAPERFTESIQLQFYAPVKNFDFEVAVLKNVE